MIVIEIIMILIGLGAVIASVKAEIDSEQIDEKIREAVKKTEEEILNKADEKFSQISNDKIMGFNEYSNEIFDKIEKNHEETVFLYNMLTEKEKEIQNLIHSVMRQRKLIKRLRNSFQMLTVHLNRWKLRMLKMIQ